MSKELTEIKKSRADEYKTVAEKRYDLLTSLDGLNEFSSKEHYRTSLLYFLNRSGGKCALARILLAHPDRALLNTVRKGLVKDGLVANGEDDDGVVVTLTDKGSQEP